MKSIFTRFLILNFYTELLCTALLLLPIGAQAQQYKVPVSEGEAVVSMKGGHSFTLIVTVSSVTIKSAFSGTQVLYTIPPYIDAYITSASVKRTRNEYGLPMTLFLVLSNNAMVTIDIPSGQVNVSGSIRDADVTASLQKLLGDDLYELENKLGNQSVYVSHDSGQTWLIDTTGFNTQHIYDMDIDSAQNVFAATGNGVFKQPLNGTVWTLTNCPVEFPNLVFVDHRNRVWVYGVDSLFNNSLYKSIDDGLSWTLASAGITGLPLASVGDDPMGNLYVIANTNYYYNAGNQLYKSSGGTGAFTRIDAGIIAYNGQPADSGIFTSVSGDSAMLYAGTSIGAFQSTDGGVTWAPVSGIPSDHCYGIAAANNGTLLVTNALACFSGSGAGPTWTKVYPDSGFAGGHAVLRDDAGDMFTQGANLSSVIGSIFGPFMTVKSTDNGNTWVADTAGISSTSMYRWWVDEAGNQYAAGGGTNAFNFTKTLAGSWTVDTTGTVRGAYDYGDAFGSDHNGKVYYALYSGNVFSRPIAGGTWAMESGLNSDPVYCFSHTANHTMIAGGTSNIHYKTGSSWQDMPVNSPVPGGDYPFVVAVDDSDYVWAGFSHQDSTGNYVGDGVFYTPDLGAHWYAPQGQIDVVTFRQLVPVGDSVFGVTYSNGIYIFKRNGGTLSGIHQLDVSQNLYLFPNPASSQCQVVFTPGSALQKTEIALYDITGREVRRIPVGSAMNEVNIKTSDLSGGTYICALEIDNKTTAMATLVIN